MFAENSTWHFGVLSFTGAGHLNPVLSLARELKSRGHRVTFFEKPKIRERVLDAGLEFVPIEKANDSMRQMPPNHGSGIRIEIAALRFNIERIIRDLDLYLAQTPEALMRQGINALIVNEVAMAGPTIAEALRLPYFLVSTSMPHHFGWKGSSWFTGYRYSASSISWLQSVYLELSALRMRGPILRALDRFRRQHGLGPAQNIERNYPRLSHITQFPQCLDRQNRKISKQFCYAGPFVRHASTGDATFPWARLDGRPMIYASLGTTRNVQLAIFRMIADACAELNVQLVIGLGNRLDAENLSDLPGQPIISKFAPQRELLKITQVVITHGGFNTVAESLMEGRPMVVIPLAYDQPAIAARLRQLQIAEVLPVMRLSPGRIRTAVTKLLCKPTYRNAAQEVKSRLLALNGTVRAADVIEEALACYAKARLMANLERRDSSRLNREAAHTTAASRLTH